MAWIVTTGGKEAVARLRQIATRAMDYRLPFEEIVQVFHAQEAVFFATGDGWAKLSPLTAAKKGHDTILVDSGKLRDSLTSVDGYQLIEASYLHPFVEVGTTVAYATYHQHGFVNWRSGQSVPARPPVQVTAEEYLKFVSILKNYIFRGTL